MTHPAPIYDAPPLDGARRHMLLISPAFPPCAEVGALRWQKFAHVAAARGWTMDVITGAALPGERSDYATLDLLPPGTRVWSLPLRPVFGDQLRRRVSEVVKATLRRPKLSNTAGATSAPSAPSASRSIGAGSDSFIASLLREHRARAHFAAWLQWCRDVRQLAQDIARAKAPHAVVSSGPPHMAHEAARQVAQELGRPLVVDLRDPWFIDHAEPADLRGRTWKSRSSRFEASCCRAAQIVVANTEPSAALLRARYPEIASRVVVVMNGADPEVRAAAGTADAFTIAHAGNLYGGRDPRPLFRGIRNFLDATHAPHERVKVRFVGGQLYEGRSIDEIAREERIDGVFSSGPALPRADALRFMGRSAVLVVLPQAWSVSIPAKIFEYMQFDAWMLVLAQPDDAAAQLLATTSADVVAPGDVDMIGHRLTLRYREWEAGGQPSAINSDGRFDRESQASQLLERIEQLAK